MLSIYRGSIIEGSSIYVWSSVNPKNFNNLRPGGDGSSCRSEYCAKIRAFRRAEAIMWIHQDKFMLFQTLTYKKQHQDYQMVLNDIKNLFSRKKISYIGVVEKHKSGNYHCHFITSDMNTIISLKKGKYSNSAWTKGFSDVKFISDTDEKFRVEKYIFKYMMKSSKIGGRYILKSRDLTVEKTSILKGAVPVKVINQETPWFSEKKVYNKDGYKLVIQKDFYK